MWRTLEEELVSQEESLVQLWEDLRCKYQKFWWSLHTVESVAGLVQQEKSHHEHEIDVKEAVKESISWIYQDLMMRDMVKGYKECFWAAGTVLITQGIGKGTRVESTHSKVELWGVICWSFNSGSSSGFKVELARQKAGWIRVDSGRKQVCFWFLQEIFSSIFDSDLRCFWCESNGSIEKSSCRVTTICLDRDWAEILYIESLLNRVVLSGVFCWRQQRCRVVFKSVCSSSGCEENLRLSSWCLLFVEIGFKGFESRSFWFEASDSCSASDSSSEIVSS